MDLETLKHTLAAEGSSVTISTGLLGSAVDALLRTHLSGGPLLIRSAKQAQVEAPDAKVVVTGLASFGNVDDVPTTATFSLTSGGEVELLVRYQMIPALAPPNAWSFSRSFTDLPVSLDQETKVDFGTNGEITLASAQRPYLDALALSDAYFVLSTKEESDATRAVTLPAGLGFVSALRPASTLGILVQTLEGDTELTFFGAIQPAILGVHTPPLLPKELGWSRTDAPGLHLRAPLPLDTTIGKARFHDVALHVYSPPSVEWMRANSTFRAVHGYSGTLEIASADIRVTAAAELEWGAHEVELSARCEGITLAKLAQLADLAGDGLAASLPSQLQRAVAKLSKLELLYVGVSLELEGVLPALRRASLLVGMPSLEWPVFGDDFVIESIACGFSIALPTAEEAKRTGAHPKVSVRVTGTVEIEGVSVDIEAHTDTGFTVYARLADGETIPLSKLSARYAPRAKLPGELTIDRLALTVAPGQLYAFSMTAASQPKPWVIAVGKDGLEISDVSIDLVYPKGGPIDGRIAGLIAFGNVARLAVDAGLDGTFTARGNVPVISIRDLVARLCGGHAAIPGSFDVVLRESIALVRHTAASASFQLGTQVDGFGSLAFEAREVAGGGWGFAFGFDLGAGNPAKLSGLAVISKFKKLLALDRLLLVTSSFEDPAFQLPSLAAFQSPRIVSKGIALPGKSGVIQGLNLFASWRLDPKNREQKLLSKLLGLGSTLGVTLQLGENPATDSRLFIAQSGKLLGNPFSYELGYQMAEGRLGVFLTGTLTAKIQRSQQTFAVDMIITGTGALLSGSMTGSNGIKFGSLELSDLAVEIGVDWAGVPSLGFAATINTRRFSSSVAIFLDSTAPSHSLLAGSVSDLNLLDVVETLSGNVKASGIEDVLKTVSLRGTQRFRIAGSLGKELDSLKLDGVAAAMLAQGGVRIPTQATQTHVVVAARGVRWFLTDLTTMRHYQLQRTKGPGSQIEVIYSAQVYCAPAETTIGRVRFPQGFRLNGAIDVLGFDAMANIEIATNRGIAVDASMDPIILVNKDVFALTAARGKGGPAVSICTYRRPKEQQKWQRSPHFYVGGKLSMLGIGSAVLAQVSTGGMDCEVRGKLAPNSEFDLRVKLGSRTGFDAGGSVKVSLPKIDLGKLGRVDANTRASARVSISANGKRVRATLDASMTIAGTRIHVKGLRLNAKTKALAKLPDTLAQAAAKELQGVFKDAGKWATAVEKGAVTGVKDTEKVLTNVYGQTGKQARQIADGARKAAGKATKGALQAGQAAGKAVSQGATSVSKAVSKEATSVGNTAGKAVSNEAKAVGKAFSGLFGKKQKKRR